MNDIEAVEKKLKKLKDDLFESGVPIDDPVVGEVGKNIRAISYVLTELLSKLK